MWSLDETPDETQALAQPMRSFVEGSGLAVDWKIVV